MANTLEVQSLHRAFDILEAIGCSGAPVSLKQITTITGLPKSTVYRLLSNLENRDYVRCDNNSNYRLGLQFFKLNQYADRDFDVKNVARSFLESLSEFTKETTHLAILEKSRVLYVDTVESPYALRLVAKVGTTNWVHCTALGKALLIKHSDQEICSILEDQGMERQTEYTLSTPAQFLQTMKEVRRLGYSLDERESEIEGRCVAAPIYNNRGLPIAAISISGLATRFSREFIEREVVQKLLESTRKISQIFGFN